MNRLGGCARTRRRRSRAELLEPRLLYSVDAFGAVAALAPLTPLIDDGLEAALEELTAFDSGVASDRPERQEIAFIVENVPDAEALAAVYRADGVRVFMIGVEQDGLQHITGTLASFEQLTAVHVVAHGSSGAVSLGSATLDVTSLETRGAELSIWGASMRDGADLLLYGCDVADGDVGTAFLGELAVSTGMDVAASDDLSGSVAAGGDWILERQVGSIETGTLGHAALSVDWQHTLATITVDRFDDVITIATNTTLEQLLDAQANSGHQVSLREALIAANNSDNQLDRILLGSGTYVLTRVGDNEDLARTGDLDVRDSLEIIGAGADQTTIDQRTGDTIISVRDRFTEFDLEGVRLTGGNNVQAGGALHTANDTVVELDGVRIDNSYSDNRGGAIYNRGDLTILDSELVDNGAHDEGGGIYNSGTLTVERTLIERNRSDTGEGGGIFSNRDDGLRLVDVVLRENVADDEGGGLFDRGKRGVLERVTFEGNTADIGGGASLRDDDAQLTNVTFSENVAQTGGGLYSDRDIAINSSTFYRNSDENQAGGHFANGGVVTLSNSVFDSNWTGDDPGNQSNLVGTVISGGYNVFSDVTGTNFLGGQAPTDVIASDLRLDGLQTTEGFVPVHTPLAGSPVINAGGNSAAAGSADGVLHDVIPDSGAATYGAPQGVVFWTDADGNIWRADTEISNPQRVIAGRPTGVDSPRDIELDLDDGRIYWIENQGQRIMSSTLDGQETPVVVLSGLASAGGFALDAQARRLFIAYGGATPRIESHDLDAPGTPTIIVDTDISQPNDIELDAVAGRLFWSEAGDAADPGSIESVDLDGSNRDSWQNEWLIDPSGLALDIENRRVYYADPERNEAGILRYDGSVRQRLGPLDAAVIDHDPVDERVTIGTESPARLHVRAELLGSAAPTVVIDAAPGGLAIAVADGGNTAPTPVTVDRIAVDEGNAFTLTAGELRSVDGDSGDEDIVYQVISLPEQGRLLIDGIDLASLDVDDRRFTQAQVNSAASVVYEHAGGDVASSDRIELQVSDGVVTVGVPTLGIDIVGVNDLPMVQTNAGLLVDEAGTAVIDASRLQSVDQESTPEDLVYALVAGDEPAHGTIVFVATPGDTPIARTSFTQAELDAGQIAYVHDGSETSSDRVSFELSDGEAQIGGQIDVTVNPVNDAPRLVTNSGFDVTEGSTRVIDSSILQVEDADNSAEELRYELVPGSEPAHGQILFRPAPDALGEVRTEFTQAELDAGQILYAHDGSETSVDGFDVRVGDTLASLDVTVDIGISESSDAPVMVNNSIVMASEGGVTIIGGSELRYTDSDDNPSDLVYTIAVDERATEGTIEFRVVPDVPGESRASFSQAELDAGQIVYVHDGSESLSDGFAYTLSDGEQSVSGRVAIDIAPVNDAPTSVTLDGQTVAENTPDATIGRLGAVDPDPGDVIRYEVDDARFIVVGDELRLAPGVTLDHEDAADIAIQISAIDSEGATRSDPFQLQILDLNDAPIAAAVPSEASLETGNVLSLPMNAFVDEDGDLLSIQATRADGTPLPAWLRFDAENVEFELLDTASRDESLAVRLIADDGRGAQTSSEIRLSLPPVPAPPEPEPPTPEPPTPEPPEPTEPEPPETELPTPEPPATEPPAPQPPEPEPAEPEAPAPAEPEPSFEPVSEAEAIFVPLDALELSTPLSPPSDTGTEAQPEDVTEPRVDIESASRAERAVSADFSNTIELGVERVDVALLLERNPDRFDDMRSDSEGAMTSSRQPIVGRLVESDIDTIDLSTLLGLPESADRDSSDALQNVLDRQREQIAEQDRLAEVLVGSSLGLSAGASLGYLIWLLRGGALLSSLLSSLPAWRFIDPLPVLDAATDREHERDESADESLESLVDGKVRPAA